MAAAAANGTAARGLTLQRHQPRNVRGGVAAAGPGPAMRSFDAPPSSSAGPSSSSSPPPAQPAASTSGRAAAAAAPAAAPRSYRVSPWQAMRFAGAVPERVNGRLAMMAILEIAHQEMLTGQTALQQAAALPHNYAAWPLLALMGLTIYAAFPPALAGAKEEDFGWMSVAAEKTNGRAAMLGLAALVALEWHSGFCFF